MQIKENKVGIGQFNGKSAYVELLEYYDADKIFQEMLNAPNPEDWDIIYETVR